MVSRIPTFDIWRPGYGGAVVSVYLAGTTTLASIYQDEALTVPADNPQTLGTMLASDGTRYGKFNTSIYTSQSYYIDVNGIEQTGVVRPALADLNEEDASGAVVTGSNSNFALSLADYYAQTVQVATFGAFVAGSGGVSATNTATLALAIAALSSGGEVIIPAGTYKIDSIEIPEGVVLVGQGLEATILQSVVGDVSFLLTGDRAGFARLTLDGSSLSTGSVAVKSVGNNETVFNTVKIKRFETGIHFLGGKDHVWVDFTIENTETAAKLHGDTDAGDTANGTDFQDLLWVGGLIDTATTKGLSLSYEDAKCQNINLVGVGFVNCVGTALDINGAQSVIIQGCPFEANTANVNIQDDTAPLTPSTENDNKVITVRFEHGRFNAGTFTAGGTCQNVVLENTKIEDMAFTLNTPISNPILLLNCFENNGVTISGETTKLIREITTQNGLSVGLTSNNTATKAWSIALVPGQMVYLEAKVIGRGQNIAQRGIYHIAAGAYRVGSALAYDTQTANFTAGKTVTGASSGATGRIQADSDGGATGTLTLTDITGVFIDNEIITDNNGTPGSATVNGTLTPTGAVVDGIGVVSLRTAYETNANWNANFVANGNEIELRVTGDTAQTVEWTVHVDVVSI